jgi:hypothetical protein
LAKKLFAEFTDTPLAAAAFVHGHERRIAGSRSSIERGIVRTAFE